MNKLNNELLAMVTGGNDDAADAYLHELHGKYGGRSVLEVLAKATDEEMEHFMALLYS